MTTEIQENAEVQQNIKINKNTETEFYLLMGKLDICSNVLSSYGLCTTDLVKKELTIRIKGKHIPNLKIEREVIQVSPDQLSQVRNQPWFKRFLETNRVIILRRQPGKNQIRTVRTFTPEIPKTKT